MKDTIASIAPVMPSAAPSEEEIRAWEALPRDEQLRRLRAALTQPDCAIATTETMADIRAEATAHSNLRRG